MGLHGHQYFLILVQEIYERQAARSSIAQKTEQDNYSLRPVYQLLLTWNDEIMRSKRCCKHPFIMQEN